MIKFNLTEQGKATNIQQCPSDYVAKEGETLANNDKVPSVDSAEHLALNSQAYRDFLVATQYQRNRQAEYPSLLELTVALYDTDDKSAVEAKRASVKAKYPKPS
jgi:hypothetical protein